MGFRSLAGRLVIVGSLLSTGPVLAQTGADRALAEALYDEGRRLMAEGQHAAACAKLEESQRLDPATGTLLNLAACREQEGRIATAWMLFKDAAAAARRDGRQDRVEYANGKAAELDPRVSRLTLEVPAASATDGLEIRLDGVVVRSVAWGIPTPVDGGRHVVEAMAPGRAPFRLEVEVAAEGDAQRVAVPALRPTAPSAAEPSAGPAPSAGGVPAPAAPPTEGTPARRPLTGVYVAAGLTGALAVGAVATGVLALGRADEFESANEDPDRSVAERESLRSDAHEMQVVNTVLTGAAIAGAGVTVVLIAIRPRVEAGSGRWRASPWVSQEGGGVALGGAW